MPTVLTKPKKVVTSVRGEPIGRVESSLRKYKIALTALKIEDD
jgi:hypothetical protein